jgi:small subunit ribosomal protein S9
MMADEENREAPEEPDEPTSAPTDAEAEAMAEHHAVPTDEATEIAPVAEDAALEAFQEHQEHVAEEVVAEAFAEVVAEDAVAEAAAEVIAEEVVAEAVAEVVAGDAGPESAVEDEDEPEDAAPRVKPSVPGAHLEVDIVPEGVDPLGRTEEYVDPYAIDEDEQQEAEPGEADVEEELSAPIATAAIDLASGARYRATGKRKTAIARVTLRPGTGTYLINGRALEVHFPRATLQRNIRQPLETVGYQERMDVVARLHGGGISSQAGALRHGVSKALLEADPNLRGELKRRGFLTRDSRVKERKKAGLKKARKRPQFSKR